MFSTWSTILSPFFPSKVNCHCPSSCVRSSPCSVSTVSDSESVGSSANSSVSYSASTSAVTSASKFMAATGVGLGWFLALLLVTGDLGGIAFFGAVAAATAGGTGLGLVTLAGLPTYTFRGTLACVGVTAGGPAGAAIA